MLLFIFYDYFYLEIELDGLTLSLFFFSHLLYHSYFVAIFFLSLENTKIFLFLEIFNYMHTFFLLANFSTPIRRSKKRNCNITFAIIWNNYSIAAIIIIIINNKKKHQMISLIVFAKFSMGKGNYFFRVKRKCSSSFFFSSSSYFYFRFFFFACASNKYTTGGYNFKYQLVSSIESLFYWMWFTCTNDSFVRWMITL